MTEHFLKIQVPAYYALRDGRKTFEARKNDRGYEVGDGLCLQPYDADVGAYLHEMPSLVFDVTHTQTFGMAEGYVGLSLKPLGILDKPQVDAVGFEGFPTFLDYQAAARRTMGSEMQLAWDDQMKCWAMGMAGEAGEVADYLKKVLYHGHPFDLDQLLKEMGDVLWYLAAMASTAGVSLQKAGDRNIAKLRLRYPAGFTQEANRARAPEPPVPTDPKPAVQPMAKPPESPATMPMVLVRALTDIPPFLGADGDVHQLKAGDVATIQSGAADLLVRRKKATIIQQAASA